MNNQTRCSWSLRDQLYIDYHDQEWGVPCYDDDKLFEFILLEGAQAGLNWHTILKKRENFRQAYCYFNAEKLARFTEKDHARLMQNAGIIRNRLKISSAIRNAQAYLKMKEQGMNLKDFFWQFVDGKPIINHWKTLEDIPTSTEISDQLSKELKRRGFNFVGTTICYAHMQAAGMVNDHVIDCFRHKEVQRNK